NEYFEIDVAALEAAILEDKAQGFQPFCIVGCVGTTNTAAIDDLDLLADIAEREGLWFHIDGAFGALAVLSEHIRPGLKGMERADSLAFDLHKWMYVPYEVGCVLVQNEDKHRRTFSMTPDYLSRAERGLSSAKTWLSDYGVQLSREFRALKVWMSIKTHGVEAYGQLIQQNIEQARYLAALVDAEPELERLAPVTLNVVCFRYVREGLSDAELNQLNDELLMDLQESGVAAPTSTLLNGKFAIRAAVTNHRSRRDDFDMFIQKVLELGRKTPT
ncbi:MAG: amino acid decarboxylase, partial [Anaerolineae bacterium]|nr:amino acid decarboxylase [Anaerolineae bacterium]